MKLSFKEFLTEEESRRSVMKDLRRQFDLGAENTYSEKQKGSRMVKLYNVGPDRDLTKLVKDVNDYIETENIEGVSARKMVSGDKAYRKGTKSIAFQFDNKVYGELNEAESTLVKNVLSFKDYNSNVYKLHVGENKGKFFITLKGEHADFALNKAMYSTGKGSEADSKTVKTTVEKAWTSARDTSAKQRGLVLKKALEKVTERPWKIES